MNKNRQNNDNETFKKSDSSITKIIMESKMQKSEQAMNLLKRLNTVIRRNALSSARSLSNASSAHLLN